ncbi:MAG: glycoside hydrolase family 65 protein, partial [Polyangiaceae bacterium]|nr:glycoside hydrolase family 65 protein [Polyangiaceae bacterium]
TIDPEWLIVEEGFQLAREHEVESIFSLANGYAGTRGSIAEGTRLSAPATYVAGVFASSESSSVPALAHVGDWTRLVATIEGERVTVDPERQAEHRRILDMRQAIQWREWRQRDAAGRVTSIRGMRLLSLADRHVFLQSVVVLPENYGGNVSVDVSISDDDCVGGDGFGLREVEPPGSGVRVAICMATLIDGQLQYGSKYVANLSMGQPRRLDRLVVVQTSRDSPEPPAERAMDHLREVVASGIDRVTEAHRQAWDERWRACDVVIRGDPASQRAMRFACYHLISAANPEDDRVSIGARALTGDAYKGHVFWDTEVYMLPFFTLTHPATARALLGYRYRTLPAARRRAIRAGCRGALYAWES